MSDAEQRPFMYGRVLFLSGAANRWSPAASQHKHDAGLNLALKKHYFTHESIFVPLCIVQDLTPSFP